MKAQNIIFDVFNAALIGGRGGLQSDHYIFLKNLAYTDDVYWLNGFGFRKVDKHNRTKINTNKTKVYSLAGHAVIKTIKNCAQVIMSWSNAERSDGVCNSIAMGLSFMK